MPVGSSELMPENLDALDNENLLSELRKAKAEMFNLRFQKATGQLETHGRITAVRRDIARIETWLRERELGIRTEPIAPLVENSKGSKSIKSKDKVTSESEISNAESSSSESPVKGILSRFRKDKSVEAEPGAAQTTRTSRKNLASKTDFDNIKSQKKVVAAPKFSRQKKG
jgi:large subunit ribosomal protein L29